jgi:protoporphyrinogen oxidase
MHVWHVYPNGGVATLCHRLAEGLEDVLELEAKVDGIIVEDAKVVSVSVNGRLQEVSGVMSTAPVHVLAKLVHGTEALQPLAHFRYRPMVFVNLRLTGRHLLPDVVTWTPEQRFPFFRITEAPWSMPWLAPPDKTLLTVDIGCETHEAIWSMPDDALVDLCLEHLQSLVPDIRRRYLGGRVLRTPIAYPLFLRAYEQERQAFSRSSGVEGLYSIGRNGEFAHILMEDVYWRTLRHVADLLRSRSTPGRTAGLKPRVVPAGAA